MLYLVMPRYILEVPHDNNKRACDLAVSIFRSTGSHFLSNALFGCPDDVHKAWISVVTHDRDDARRIVPPPFRDKVKVTRVRRFALEKVEKNLKPHHK